MRTHDGQVQGITVQVNNNSGQFPGGSWTNPNPGRYEFYLAEPGAKWLSVTPTPNASGSSLAIWYWNANNDQPAHANVGFQTSAGVAGNYGGSVALVWRRGQA